MRAAPRNPTMNDPESDLREHFQAERKRDGLEAPSFESLVATEDPIAPEPLRTQWRRPTVMLLAAATLAAASVIPFLDRPSSQVPPTAEAERNDSRVSTDSPLDLDELCDAALAALDEHEAEWLMAGPTDVLLQLGQ